MRRSTLLVLGGLLAVGGSFAWSTRPAGAQQAAAQAATPAEAVKARLAGFVKAFNGRNAQELAAFFNDDARLISLDDTITDGKGAITDQFAAGFTQPSGYTLETHVESVRLITAEVAQVEGLSKLTAKNEPSVVNRFVTLLTKKGKDWTISEIRDLPAPPEDVPPADRLKELEWMVGDWVNEKGDVKVQASISWGDRHAYMIRHADVTVGQEKTTSSLTIIGWDPRSGQIRSWSFDAEGGVNTATWSRAGDNQWMVRTDGHARDGSSNASTQIITLEGKDAVRTSSTDRVVAGQVASDVEDVLLVRKPPAPAARR